MFKRISHIHFHFEKSSFCPKSAQISIFPLVSSELSKSSPSLSLSPEEKLLSSNVKIAGEIKGPAMEINYANFDLILLMVSLPADNCARLEKKDYTEVLLILFTEPSWDFFDQLRLLELQVSWAIENKIN